MKGLFLVGGTKYHFERKNINPFEKSCSIFYGECRFFALLPSVSRFHLEGKNIVARLIGQTGKLTLRN